MNNTTYRPTWAEINLDAVSYNLSRIRGLLTDEVDIMAVVKADAYGHGICQVSSVLIDDGIGYLGVATIDEALKLRDAGFSVPVLVLGSMLEEEARIAIEKDITMTVCDEDMVEMLDEIVAKTKKRPKIHVKVDTGMGRIGVWHEDAVSFVKALTKNKNIETEGIYTHFSSAGRDKMVTTLQISSFEKVLEDAESCGISFRYKHAANSIALVDWKKSHMNLVRPGILLYGIYPKENFRRNFKLKPAMNLKTKIVYLKDTPPGRSISYGRTYITQKNTKIATVPIGYADGYGRILSNKAEALVNGQYVRVVGRVTMDQTLLDVGHVADVKVGDEVVLIGRQGESEILAEKIAKLAGTIPYEIVAGITGRVPRIYYKD